MLYSMNRSARTPESLRLSFADLREDGIAQNERLCSPKKHSWSDFDMNAAKCSLFWSEIDTKASNAVCFEQARQTEIAFAL
jgi:hypothetical protein